MNIYIQATDEDSKRAIELLNEAHRLFLLQGRTDFASVNHWGNKVAEFQQDMMDRKLREDIAELADLALSTDEMRSGIIAMLERRGVLKSA